MERSGQDCLGCVDNITYKFNLMTPHKIEELGRLIDLRIQYTLSLFWNIYTRMRKNIL